MTTQAMLSDELTTIFRDVFDDETLVPTDHMTAADVQNWDSLTHINLIVAIEKHFKIKFTTGEVTGLKNVGDLKALILKKNAIQG